MPDTEAYRKFLDEYRNGDYRGAAEILASVGKLIAVKELAAILAIAFAANQDLPEKGLESKEITNWNKTKVRTMLVGLKILNTKNVTALTKKQREDHNRALLPKNGNRSQNYRKKK